MKKFLVVFLLGLVIAGSAFAQGYNGYNQVAQAPQTTISGTLQVINGTLAIINAANQLLCYVPDLQPYYGANGLCVNAPVTVCGTITNNNCYPSSFMAGGIWYTVPIHSNNVKPVQPVQKVQPTYVPPTYVPPVVVVIVPVYPQPQSCYPRYYGC